MYTKDDQTTAKIGDRIVAAAIAGFGGFFVGSFIALAAVMIFGTGYWLAWLVTFGCGLFAFLAPSRSRELWGRIWESLVRIMAALYGWRG